MNTNYNINDVDFQTKAHSIASNVSSLSPTEALAKSLTCDRPTIDSAIKSYMSLCAARSMSSNTGNDHSTTGIDAVSNRNRNYVTKCYFKGDNPQKSSLQCARSLLKAINSFMVPTSKDTTDVITNNKRDDDKINGVSNDDDDGEKRLEFEVVRILWNALVKNGQKPSMLLGQKSLVHILPLINESCFQIVMGNDDDYSDDNNDKIINVNICSAKQDNNNGKKVRDSDYYPKDVDYEEAKSFIIEFQNLLIAADKRKHNLTSSSSSSSSIMTKDNNGESNKSGIYDYENDDSCLLWDLDGGKAELERRRKRREIKSSCVRIDENNNNSDQSPTIVTNEEIERIKYL